MKNYKHLKPPFIAERLVRYFLRDEDRTHRLGDFEEVYQSLSKESGKIRAWKWYWKQVLSSLPGLLLSSFYWSIVMIRNYAKIAFRNLFKHKVYSFINIAGLAVGMVCCILIFMYVFYELSYDRYHKNAENIYRVITTQAGNVYQGTDRWAVTPGLLAPTIKQDFPEVEKSTRLCWFPGIVKRGDKSFRESGIYMVDPDFLEIFTFPLVKGNMETSLIDPYSILLTEDMAEKYFGNEDPVGNTIRIKDNIDFKVTGVLKNVPENSHFRFDFIGSFKTLYSVTQRNIDQWNSLDYVSYITLRDKYDPADLEKKFPAFEKKYQGENGRNKFFLQPLTNIHLHSKLNFELSTNGDVKSLYIISAIAVFILLIACFNYMNLSTARSTTRAKEVGLRKVVGAGRKQLIWQFMGESVFFSLFAFILALLMVNLVLPSYNSLTGKQFTFGSLISARIFSCFIGTVILVALASGSYPAMFLSSFKPVNILKGNLKTGSGRASLLRNSLVVFQFIVSSILIICSIITFKQLDFIKNKELGYEKENIIAVYSWDNNLRKNYEPLKNELLKNPNVNEITTSRNLPYNIRGGGSGSDWEGKTGDKKFNIYRAWIDYDFINFYGLDIVKGRGFSREFTGDAENAYILNETAAKKIGWDNPIGKRFKKGVVIGVMKDFHFYPLHYEIEGLWLRLSPADISKIPPKANPYNETNGYISIKVNPDNTEETIGFLKEKFNEFSPAYPFYYYFLDDRIQGMYTVESKTGKIFNYFTMISIFIASLGLFGLASFTITQKSKEIGIRKVLGASVPGIIIRLSKEYLVKVIIAGFIAFPAAWYVMNRWLQDFAYRVDIGIGTFAVTAGLVILITILTVSFKAYNAAVANPVNSIRDE